MSELEVWVIFDHPTDHPDHYVVRCQRATLHGIRHDPDAFLFDTLNEARRYIGTKLARTRLERSPDDDPVIVETWI